MAFQAIRIGDTGDKAADDIPRVSRATAIARRFREEFGVEPDGVATAPGRVNLIGEHIDYEGYSVLPMAIEQDVCIAFASQVSARSVPLTDDKDDSFRLQLDVSNTKSDLYSCASRTFIVPPGGAHKEHELFGGKQAWANYVVCGVLGAFGFYSNHMAPQTVELRLLVDGCIPPGCGLSSSSAVVVATAIATARLLARCTAQSMPSRLEMAQLCRRAERFVGTMGGGMDQAISCLGKQGHALHISFTPTLQVVPVSMSTGESQSKGFSFVVANSGVTAMKAEDASTRFNKRVVECALAAKRIGRQTGLANWESLERLVDVQQQLESMRGVSISFRELQQLALECCPQNEYTLEQLEGASGFGVEISTLFATSKLLPGVRRVVAATKTFKLQQRAYHVWAEAERVHQFQSHCTLLGQSGDDDTKILQQLGHLMLESHRSCQTLYECSCDELDRLVAVAMENGAFGARLTGAGWGGCIVALAPTSHVDSIIEHLQEHIRAQSTHVGMSGEAVFKSSPSAGADIYVLGDSCL